MHIEAHVYLHISMSYISITCSSNNLLGFCHKKKIIYRESMFLFIYHFLASINVKYKCTLIISGIIAIIV